MSTTTKGIRLSETDGCIALRWEGDGYQLYWNADPDIREFPERVHSRRVSEVNVDEGAWASDVWVAFSIQDCFDPPVYIVRASSWEEAYETFIDWQVDQLKIEEADLKDYDEGSLHYSSNGVPVDTESVYGVQVRLIESRWCPDLVSR